MTISTLKCYVALPSAVRDGIDQRYAAVVTARAPGPFSDALGELEYYLDGLVDAEVIPFDLRVELLEPISRAWAATRNELQALAVRRGLTGDA